MIVTMTAKTASEYAARRCAVTGPSGMRTAVRLTIARPAEEDGVVAPDLVGIGHRKQRDRLIEPGGLARVSRQHGGITRSRVPLRKHLPAQRGVLDERAL